MSVSMWELLQHDAKMAVVRAGRLSGKSIKTLGDELGVSRGCIAGFIARWLSDDTAVVQAGEENHANDCRKRTVEWRSDVLDKPYWTREQLRGMNNRALARLAAAHPDMCPPQLKRQVVAAHRKRTPLLCWTVPRKADAVKERVTV